ncbi:hypothetical protein FHE72_11190 [Rossellomorea vietnamensis]|uniref:Uncharacterized protein n=1 Tax=Rossellomorea vietnamensis TaxID=218284 RepID=A0A6I6URQ9_9BACI|nr:hypothetical protein [Rossellomorea vietnamensis]QHE61522.1 hypothetical protein FHE72_11190 [Rossellomorea vietnamensis]
MLSKEKALEEIQKHLIGEEIIENSIMTHYKAESGYSGVTGGASTSGVPVKGVLASTNLRILFYGELAQGLSVFREVFYRDITNIKQKKESFALFKSIPVYTVSHKDRETFTSQGYPEELTKLQTFFNRVKDTHLKKEENI